MFELCRRDQDRGGRLFARFYPRVVPVSTGWTLSRSLEGVGHSCARAGAVKHWLAQGLPAGEMFFCLSRHEHE